MALSLFSTGRPNSLWDPFELVHFHSAGSFVQSANAIAATKVDWLETDDGHVFKADLLGLEDVKMELEETCILQISGERRQEEDRWHTVDCSHEKFLHRFKLPDNAQSDSVSAKVDDGVLTVTVPKIQTKTCLARSIDVA